MKMTHFTSELRAALLAAGILAAVPAVYAQEQAPPAPDEQTAPEPATSDPSNTVASTPVTDAKIDQFATAYVAVQQIQAKTSEQLSTTTDVAKANEVKAAAETEMIKAVEKSGLQVDEFNQIAQLMASDETLRSKVITKVQEIS
jgi:hypothetical protein